MYLLVYYVEIEWVNVDDCLLGLILIFSCLIFLYKCFMVLNLERFIFVLSLLNLFDF